MKSIYFLLICASNLQALQITKTRSAQKNTNFLTSLLDCISAHNKPKKHEITTAFHPGSRPILKALLEDEQIQHFYLTKRMPTINENDLVITVNDNIWVPSENEVPPKSEEEIYIHFYEE